MMKVSDPIIFGHAVRAYFPDVFAKHGAALERPASTPTTASARCSRRIEELPDDERARSRPRSQAAYATARALAMVDSDRGITNLHVPSDVIIDASMPAAIRSRARCGTPTASSRTRSS